MLIKCCICGAEFEGFGNNPYPVCTGEDERCCDKCNMEYVVPARIKALVDNKKESGE